MRSIIHAYDGVTSLWQSSPSPLYRSKPSLNFSLCEVLSRPYSSKGSNVPHSSLDIMSSLNDVFDALGNGDSISGRKRSRKQLVTAFMESYQSLPHISLRNDPHENSSMRKETALRELASMPPNTDMIDSVVNDLQESTGKPATIHRTHQLWSLCEPPYYRLFTWILREDSGLSFLVKFREDVRVFVRMLKHRKRAASEELVSAIVQMDHDLKGVLSIQFAPHVLELHRITYSASPAAVIERIALKEAVHPLKSLDDLRNRLKEGRRCFALFHPLMKGDPLVFVHAALLDNIPRSMEEIDAGTADGGKGQVSPKVAAFYSITSAQPGLAGIDLGQHLLKSVMLELQSEFPMCIQTFVTLSPLPRLRKWLEGEMENEADNQCESKLNVSSLLTMQERRDLEIVLKSSTINDVANDLSRVLSGDHWLSNPDVKSVLEPILLRLAAHYLLFEKHKGKPVDGVAKFHLRNGAQVYRLNFLADPSRRGMHQSLGLMVNYLYDLSRVEENANEYEFDGKLPVSEEVGQAFSARPQS